MKGNTSESATGKIGENLARSLLSSIARVRECESDEDLDFECNLRNFRSVKFYIQAKGSAAPFYPKTTRTIKSLPIKRKTIESWLEDEYPVFILMSDTYRRKTYYTLVSRDTYKPTGDGDRYRFSIPLDNRITHFSIRGEFLDAVMREQPHFSQERLRRSIEEYWQENAELYRNLQNETDRFLEMMRGSDQEAQMEVTLFLKQQVEDGKPIAPELVEGLVSILINCKDRITQNHALNALVALNEGRRIPELVPQVLKQIERNMRLYKYRRHEGEAWRSSYTDSLFYALVRLQARGILKEMKRFLAIKDLAVNRNAIRACGWLRLNEAIEDVLRFLGHPDDGVRYDVAQALSQLSRTKVIPRLKEVLKTSPDELQIAGAIQTLAELRDQKTVAAVLPFADDSSRDVRRAVALYLGAIDPVGHIDLLLHIMVNDDDHQVRSAAMQSVHKCLPVAYPDEFEELEAPALPQGPTMTVEELEQRVLPLLKEAYENRQIPQADSLLSLCRGPQSLPTLVDIYLDENAPPRETYEFKGPTGDVESTREIHLKPVILNILKQYSPPEISADVMELINADVVQQIRSADSREKHYYITAAGEMKLKAAFEPITTLISEEKVKHKHLVVSALVSIDSAKARAWAVETLRSNPSLKVSLVCFDIIDQAGPEQEDDDLVKTQILRLMNDADVRRNRQIYDYVDRYKVMEAALLVVNDLRTGEEPIELALFGRMLKTLAVLKTPEGRDVLIDSLEIVGDGLKYRIIAYLGDIGDSKSIDAVREYSDYPDPEISKLVKKILDSAEGGK